MADQRAKGNIFYEILIVVLAAALIGSIVYPKNLANHEEVNIEICRYRMVQVQKAALQYQKYNSVYTDTLSLIFDFIRTSDAYAHYVDSVAVGGLDSIVTRLREFNAAEEHIFGAIPSATDSVMIDSLVRMQIEIKLASRRLAGYVEYVHDKMNNLPNMPMEELREAFTIIDSKKFTLDMNIVQNSIESGQLKAAQAAAKDVSKVIVLVRDQMQAVADAVPNYAASSLDALGLCPTLVGEQLQLVHIDTSVIKFLNIYCPVDSSDISIIESSFLKSTIGGLKLKNHGKIESGEMSWE